MTQVTVVIPVFNTEDYISECLDSVLCQENVTVEVICIDDASTDSTPDIIKQYCAQYANLTLIRVPQNQKQGAARNIGIHNATGDYITFVDADDRLPPKALATMLRYIESMNADIVTGKIESFNVTNRWTPLNYQSDLYNQCSITTLTETPTLLENSSACNKLFSKPWLDTHHLLFPEIGAGEDGVFVMKALLKARTIGVIPDVVYQYRALKGKSSSGRTHSHFFKERVEAALSLQAYFKTHTTRELYPQYILTILSKLVGPRFDKALQDNLLEEKYAILKSIAKLTQHIDLKSLIENKNLSSESKFRILLIRDEKYDFLIQFELYFLHKKNYLPFLNTQLFSDEIKSFIEEEYFELPRPFKKRASLKAQSRTLLAVLKYLACIPLAQFRRKILKKTPYWLIDERISTRAQDNAFYFFQYLRREHPNLPIYYVLEKHSVDLAQVKPLGNVVTKYSFAHAFRLAGASTLLSTDNFRGLAYPMKYFPKILKKTHNVYLKHGIIGNKTVTYSKEKYSYFSQIMASSELEKKFWAKYYHFEDNQIEICGLSRFDHLSQNHKPTERRSILVSPTWRVWINQTNDIQESYYFQIWQEFLNHEKLHSILSKHNLELIFYPHFKVAKHLAIPAHLINRISILGENRVAPLADFIRSASLLITDYSSVMYDFFYQHKPVICYMFDRTLWEAQLPGPPHINFDEELPASIAAFSDQLFENMEEAISNDFQISEGCKNKTNHLIKYLDNNNSRRIYDSIHQALHLKSCGKKSMCTN